MSVLIKDLITAYRMGIKTLYYHQENDMAGEIEIKAEVPIFVESTDSLEDEFCESCAI
jgi:hypothetical protein